VNQINPVLDQINVARDSRSILPATSVLVIVATCGWGRPSLGPPEIPERVADAATGLLELGVHGRVSTRLAGDLCREPFEIVKQTA